MKIAFIGQKGIPATFGGVEYHVDELSRRLVKRGHRVDVYVRSWYTQKGLKDWQGVCLLKTPTIRSKHLDAFVHSLTSSTHSLGKNYDIVHYHALGPSFFAWIPQIRGHRVVATIHRLDWQAGKWGRWAKHFLKLCELFAVHVPQRTIVVSKTLKKYFKAKYGRDLFYIPNGVTLPSLLPPELISKKYNLRGNDYLLFMGRLVPEKRPDWLIRAFLEVAPANPDLRLVVAGGEGGAEGYLASLHALARTNKKIIFTDYVTGREKEELFSNALLFVLPSYLEGLPIALLEAMSYGLGCLASDIDPHREVINPGEDGHLFNRDDFSDLVSTLNKILRSQDNLKRLGEKARLKVQNNYDWEFVTAATEKVYLEALTRV